MATVGSYQGATSSPTGHLTLKPETGDFFVSLESVLSGETLQGKQMIQSPALAQMLCVQSRLSHLNTQNSVIDGGCSASMNPSM